MASSKGRWRGRLIRVWAELDDFTGRNAINLGAVVAAGVLLARPPLIIAVIGLLAGLASLTALVWRRWDRVVRPSGDNLLGYFVSVRVLLLLAAAGAAAARRPADPWIWVGIGIAALLVLAEPLIRGLLGTTKVSYANVPGVRRISEPRFAPSWLFLTSLGVLAVGALVAVLALPGWVLLAAALAAVPASVTIAVGAVKATLASKAADRALLPALRKLRPEFAVYYAALSGARYQLGMWLPYLERLNRPFLVITRNPETVPVIAELTSAPVVAPKPGKDQAARLDALVLDSLKAAFYVQGSPGNQTFQRYRGLTHVWLNHGDSDKQANFHPRHATYDKLFVSGQQGVDRYAAHGIDVAPDRFAIVGRPQIEKIEVRDSLPPADVSRTILYAPTWRGGRPSSNYSSLPVGLQIVQAVLARGSRVIFRPHPLSYNDPADAKRIRAIHEVLESDRRSTGREHLWGSAAETERDVPACFNDSDALITDVSSIASDYLASGKPFAMVAVQERGPSFRREFPTARVAYVIEYDLSNLADALAHLHASDPADDPLAEARRAYRTYCLGEWLGPRAAEEFLRVAGEIVAGRPVETRAPAPPARKLVTSDN